MNTIKNTIQHLPSTVTSAFYLLSIILLYHTVPVCTHFLLRFWEASPPLTWLKYMNFTWFHLLVITMSSSMNISFSCLSHVRFFPSFFCILCPPKAMQSQESDGPSSPGLEVTWELVRVFEYEEWLCELQRVFQMIIYIPVHSIVVVLSFTVNTLHAWVHKDN